MASLARSCLVLGIYFLRKVYINVDLFISFIDSFDYTFPPDFPLFLQQKKRIIYGHAGQPQT